ncbi:MAG TPA: T9SS type A sorting domain-containing protein, partial [Saprospiraceae bacterium]|nr:T9SS type A sorting domain-containing protein [Saprospiraceae bacterium]
VGQVYPNPFTTELHVRLEGRQAGAAQFHLFDAAGRLVLSRTEILQEGMQTVSFGLNDRLPGGVYYLRVSDAAGEISTHPVVRVDD